MPLATKRPLPPLPPFDGSVTVLPGFVEFQATHNPDRLCAVWPSASSPSGTRGVTFAEFNDAASRVAQILRPDRAGADGEVVGVIIHTDVLAYMVVLAGMFKAGIVVRAFFCAISRER